MVKLVKEFVHYLLDIGILNINSVHNFFSFYQNLFNSLDDNFNELSMKDLLIKTLNEYISNLSDSDIFEMSSDILIKFADNKRLEKIKKVKVLYELYSRGFKIIKQEKFNLWKNYSNFIKESFVKSSIPSIKGSLFSDLKEHNFYKSKIETSAEIKEKEEFNKCTFKPKINKISLSLNRNSSIFERLYTDFENYSNKRNVNILKKELKESKSLSFVPDMSLTKHKNQQNESFMKRQIEYKKLKSNKNDNVRNSLDSIELANCTFKPKILYKKNVESQVRLYLNGKSKDMNNSSANNSISKSIEKKSVNYKKLENLYNDYKKFNTNKKDLQISFDKEDGITFKPEISHKFSPSNNFIERNNKFIEDKKTFYENNKNFEKENNKKIHTNEIIDRLYQKSIDKVIQRNKMYSEVKFDFNNILRKENENTRNRNLSNLKNNTVDGLKNVETIIENTTEKKYGVIKRKVNNLQNNNTKKENKSFRSNSMKILLQKKIP